MATEKTDSNLKHLCKAIADGNETDFRRYLKKVKNVNACITFTHHTKLYDTVSPLFLAVNTNQKNLVRVLLNNGAKPNDCGPRPPLVAAARSNNETIVDLLLTAGANVNCEDLSDGFTPLHAAVWVEATAITIKLIASGASIDAQVGGIGLTALIIASGKGYFELTQILLAAGANLTVQVIHDKDKPAGNALTEAFLASNASATAKQKLPELNIRIIKALLAFTDPVKHEAFLNHSLKMASLTCEEAYYLILNTLVGRLPQSLLDNMLIQVISVQNQDYVIDILKRGANPNTMGSSIQIKTNTTIFTPAIYIAAQLNNLAIVKLLSAHGADLNKCATNGESALYFAAVKNYEPIVRFLLSHPNIILNSDFMPEMKHPLKVAIALNHMHFLELFLNHEQLQSLAWKKQNSVALCFAVISSSDWVVQRLLTAGFSPFEAGFRNLTAVSIAVGGNKPEIVRILLVHMLKTIIYKARVAELRLNSMSLLELAYCFESKEAAAVLIEFGAHPQLVLFDNPDKTIAQWLTPDVPAKNTAANVQSSSQPITTPAGTPSSTVVDKPPAAIPVTCEVRQVTLTYSKRKYLREVLGFSSETIDIMLSERNKEAPQDNRQRFFTKTREIEHIEFSWFGNVLRSSAIIQIENSTNCFFVINDAALYEQDCTNDQLQKFKTIRSKFDDDHIKKLQNEDNFPQDFVINCKLHKGVSPTHELRDPTSEARLLLYPFLCDKKRATLYIAAKCLPKGLHEHSDVKSLAQQSKIIYLDFRRNTQQFMA